jgi:anaerobic ribonucleoside-triphosphate reductase activating protein
MSTDIRLFGVKWSTDQGGPSPDKNMRTELYFMGCERAAAGDPCDGCYNPDLWENRPGALTRTPEDMATHISKHAPNKFITIVGGEPTDQFEGLIALCKLLKADGFHIIVFTWKNLKNLMMHGSYRYRELIENIDILVDGQYRESERIYVEDAGDGFLNTIGSANQIIWDIKEWNDSGGNRGIYGHTAGELAGIYVLPNGDLRYITKKNVWPKITIAQRGAA